MLKNKAIETDSKNAKSGLPICFIVQNNFIFMH
jgi:hypothetical protein